MQRDLCDYEATVAIIQATNDMDEAKHMLDEFIAKGNLKPNQYTLLFRDVPSNVPQQPFVCAHFDLCKLRHTQTQ